MLCLAVALLTACNRNAELQPSKEPGSMQVAVTNTPTAVPDIPAVHVYPGDDIQEALDDVASKKDVNTVVVHAGTYRPSQPQQALIWFNRRHDGIHLRAEGDVTLTSANPDVAEPSSKSFPAIANHVVYFGDGIGPDTKMEGFKITGANNFVTTKGPVIEPADDPRLKRTPYFFFDGGGIKIFGRSYPTLEQLEVHDNYSSPCGAGISVEHRGFTDDRVTIRNCVLRNNRAPLTGAALDLLGHDKGSAALVENCLFVNNASNCSMDDRSLRLGSWMQDVGHGAITLFQHSKGEFRKCTIVGNRNGVDDLSPSSTYSNCVFWDNTATGGWPTGRRYETSVTNGAGVNHCLIGGSGLMAQGTALDPSENVLDAPDPEFDENYVPRSVLYEEAGYRPTNKKPEVRPPEVPELEAARHAMPTVTLQEPLLVRARGSNFSWYFSYSGDDGIPDTSDDVRTRRHLYVPTGRSVQLQLESDDYLYSLKLPAQGANEIAVPGLVHVCNFTETKSGSYPLRGDQFCGYTHPDLIGRVIVQPPSRFRELITTNNVQ